MFCVVFSFLHDVWVRSLKLFIFRDGGSMSSGMSSVGISVLGLGMLCQSRRVLWGAWLPLPVHRIILPTEAIFIIVKPSHISSKHPGSESRQILYVSCLVSRSCHSCISDALEFASSHIHHMTVYIHIDCVSNVRQFVSPF